MLLLVWLFWLLPDSDLATPASSSSRSLDFSLIVASCFHGDTVAVAINEQNLLTAVATSDVSTGVTAIGIYQDQHGLWVRLADKTVRYPRLDLHQELRLRLALNGQVSSHVVNLRKGRVLLLNSCFEVTTHRTPARKLTVHQYQKPVTLE